MFYLACTRFNCITWQENTNYKTKNNINGIIYGVPITIYNKYPLILFYLL